MVHGPWHVPWLWDKSVDHLPSYSRTLRVPLVWDKEKNHKKKSSKKELPFIFAKDWFINSFSLHLQGIHFDFLDETES